MGQRDLQLPTESITVVGLKPEGNNRYHSVRTWAFPWLLQQHAHEGKNVESTFPFSPFERRKVRCSVRSNGKRERVPCVLPVGRSLEETTQGKEPLLSFQLLLHDWFLKGKGKEPIVREKRQLTNGSCGSNLQTIPPPTFPFSFRFRGAFKAKEKERNCCWPSVRDPPNTFSLIFL